MTDFRKENFFMQPTSRYVLYAEDDPDDVLLFHEALNSYDPVYQVVDATDAESAMRKLVHLEPSAIFLDINMPGTDGFSCMESIRRKFDNLRKVPIVLLSTSKMMNEEASRRGADYYFVKPVLQEKWQDIFKAVLQLKDISEV